MKAILIINSVFALRLKNPNGEPTLKEIEESRKFDENGDEAKGSVEFDNMMKGFYERDMQSWKSER